MTTREEIEAAASEYRHCYANPTSCNLQEFDRCAHTLATSHVTYLAERQRRIETAAEELDSVLTELSCVASPKARQVAIARVITKHLEQS